MLIGVDWGTSRLRAYLIGDAGEIRATLEAEKGLMHVPAGGYAGVLEDCLLPWRDEMATTPILMSGMVGSRQGWQEVPYAELPVTIEDLAAATKPVVARGFHDLAIVPGVAAGMDGSTWGDVMRGEEVEVFGALAELGLTEATLVLPGSHAKWVHAADGAIVRFQTFMTGEVFDALARHTILSKMMPLGGADPESFARGAAAARELEAAGTLLTRLFNIRAETLFGRQSEDGAADFLSGLLIGAEVAAAAGDVKEVVVVGAANLTARYRAALDLAGIKAVAAPPQAAATGLRLIAAARAGA